MEKHRVKINPIEDDDRTDKKAKVSQVYYWCDILKVTPKKLFTMPHAELEQRLNRVDLRIPKLANATSFFKSMGNNQNGLSNSKSYNKSEPGSSDKNNATSSTKVKKLEFQESPELLEYVPKSCLKRMRGGGRNNDSDPWRRLSDAVDEFEESFNLTDSAGMPFDGSYYLDGNTSLAYDDFRRTNSRAANSTSLGYDEMSRYNMTDSSNMDYTNETSYLSQSIDDDEFEYSYDDEDYDNCPPHHRKIKGTYNSEYSGCDGRLGGPEGQESVPAEQLDHISNENNVETFNYEESGENESGIQIDFEDDFENIQYEYGAGGDVDNGNEYENDDNGDNNLHRMDRGDGIPLPTDFNYPDHYFDEETDQELEDNDDDDADRNGDNDDSDCQDARSDDEYISNYKYNVSTEHHPRSNHQYNDYENDIPEHDDDNGTII